MTTGVIRRERPHASRHPLPQPGFPPDRLPPYQRLLMWSWVCSYGILFPEDAVKHYHETINKKSRFTRAPEISAMADAALPAMDPHLLKSRIAAALQRQNDYFPCFDWTFPPPISQKTRGSRAGDDPLHPPP